MNDIINRIESLENKYDEIISILKYLRNCVPENKENDVKRCANIGIKTGVKSIIKQGMSDYYSGKTFCPYVNDDLNAEYWQMGFDNAKDTWAEIKK